MYYIFGNYGNHTIALIQWAHLQQLLPITVLHVNTGWGSSQSIKRATQGQDLALRYGFSVITLKPTQDFTHLIRDRRDFPTSRYQWCTTFLKALPLLTFLDEVDPACESTILLGARRETPSRQNLQEFVEESEHYGNRKVWYPLYNTRTQACHDLIQQTGLDILKGHSGECSPCIHSSLQELFALESIDRKKVHILENEMKQTMFHARYPNISIENFREGKTLIQDQNTLLEMGCGSFYMCGE